MVDNVHAFNIVQYVLLLVFIGVMVFIAVWDGYFALSGRPEYTVSQLFKQWRDQYILVIVIASFIFYHLVIEAR